MNPASRSEAARGDDHEEADDALAKGNESAVRWHQIFDEIITTTSRYMIGSIVISISCGTIYKTTAFDVPDAVEAADRPGRLCRHVKGGRRPRHRQNPTGCFTLGAHRHVRLPVLL
jgi:hypothetical protein